MFGTELRNYGTTELVGVFVSLTTFKMTSNQLREKAQRRNTRTQIVMRLFNGVNLFISTVETNYITKRFMYSYLRLTHKESRIMQL
jgi:hypothetical protein